MEKHPQLVGLFPVLNALGALFWGRGCAGRRRRLADHLGDTTRITEFRTAVVNFHAAYRARSVTASNALADLNAQYAEFMPRGGDSIAPEQTFEALHNDVVAANMNAHPGQQTIIPHAGGLRWTSRFDAGHFLFVNFDKIASFVAGERQRGRQLWSLDTLHLLSSDKTIKPKLYFWLESTKPVVSLLSSLAGHERVEPCSIRASIDRVFEELRSKMIKGTPLEIEISTALELQLSSRWLPHQEFWTAVQHMGKRFARTRSNDDLLKQRARLINLGMSIDEPTFSSEYLKWARSPSDSDFKDDRTLDDGYQFHPTFVHAIKKLSKFTPTSCAVEGVFSVMAWLIGSRRAKLTAENAATSLFLVANRHLPVRFYTGLDA